MGSALVLAPPGRRRRQAGASGTGLRRPDFIEAKIRMAVKKFAKQELAPSEMFEKLITDHLMPYAKQATQDEFHKLLHTPEVQNIFAEFNEEINAVFKHYAAGDLKTASVRPERPMPSVRREVVTAVKVTPRGRHH